MTLTHRKGHATCILKTWMETWGFPASGFKILHCLLSHNDCQILSAIQQDTRPNKKRKKGAGGNTSLAQIGYLKVFWVNRKETVSTSSFTDALEGLTWGEDTACLGTADFHIQLMLPPCCKESLRALEVELVCHAIEKCLSKRKPKAGCKSKPQSPTLLPGLISRPSYKATRISFTDIRGCNHIYLFLIF